MQLAVGHHQTRRNPDDLVPGQEQSVSESASESVSVFDCPGHRGGVVERADPRQERRDQQRAVLHRQRLATLTARWVYGNRDVDVLVRVDANCHHREFPSLRDHFWMTGQRSRALAKGHTYCELTARQASIKSLPARALAHRAAMDISTEGLSARVLRVTRRPAPEPLPSKKPRQANAYQ